MYLLVFMKTNKLKEIRVILGLSQGELGQELGLSSSTSQSRISHYESNRRLIPTDIAYRLIDLAAASGLDVDLGEIYPRPKTAA